MAVALVASLLLSVIAGDALGAQAGARRVPCTEVATGVSLGDGLNVGDVLEDGLASVAVQPPGVGVTANVLAVNGSSELTTETTKEGAIVVSHCGLDAVEDETETLLGYGVVVP